MSLVNSDITTKSKAILPQDAKCTSCGDVIHWQDLMQGMYRIKDEEANKVMPGRATAAAKLKGKRTALEATQEEDSTETDDDTLTHQEWSIAGLVDGDLVQDNDGTFQEDPQDEEEHIPRPPSLARVRSSLGFTSSKPARSAASKKVNVGKPSSLPKVQSFKAISSLIPEKPTTVKKRKQRSIPVAVSSSSGGLGPAAVVDVEDMAKSQSAAAKRRAVSDKLWAGASVVAPEQQARLASAKAAYVDISD